MALPGIKKEDTSKEKNDFSFLDNYKKYYKKVKHYEKAKSKSVIILNCCKLKNNRKELLPCSQRYWGKDFDIINNLLTKRYVDVYVISAQYGLIPYTENILNYNVSFNDLTEQEIKDISSELHIREDLEKVLKDHELAFILFGKRYGYALNIDEKINTNCTLVSFGKDMNKTLICDNKLEIDVNINKLARKIKGYRSANAKTNVISLILQQYTDDELIINPNLIKELVTNMNKNSNNLIKKIPQ